MHYSFSFTGRLGVGTYADLEDFTVSCEADTVHDAITALRSEFDIASTIKLVATSSRRFACTLD